MFYVRESSVTVRPFSVSTSNLTAHMVGSLKKGSKQSLSLPSTAYNTLPSQHHLQRAAASSPRFIQSSNSSHLAGADTRFRRTIATLRASPVFVDV